MHWLKKRYFKRFFSFFCLNKNGVGKTPRGAALLEIAVLLETAALFFNPLDPCRSIRDCRSNRDCRSIRINTVTMTDYDADYMADCDKL